MIATLTAEQVEEMILAALGDVNDELDDEDKVEISPATPLFGVEAQIDSLSLVSLIVDVETALNVDHDLPVSLTDDRAMTREVSPFSDVQALKDYILELAAEHA
jgi:acyl carrier protein